MPKLAMSTRDRDIDFLKQKKAVKKKSTVGSIPQSAPLVKACMTSGFQFFSRCIQTSTRAPVRGMTPTSPAAEGNFFPIAVAARMMATLKNTLINKCMIFFFSRGSVWFLLDENDVTTPSFFGQTGFVLLDSSGDHHGAAFFSVIKKQRLCFSGY